jgi:superfamily I DNA and/or RNA helicase
MLVKVPSVKILRVYSRDVESEALNNTQDSTQSTVIKECEPVALHMRVRGADNPNANALLICIKEINQLSEKIEESRKKGKNCDELVKKLASKKLKYNAILDAAERYEFVDNSVHVILCTCVEAGSSRMRKFARVTQCIVDECNMCLDAELLVPLVTAGQQCNHVVMIGDEKELVPVIRSKSAKKLGLGRSLFESLCEHHEGKKYGCCLLRMQFRMVCCITGFLSCDVFPGPSVQ